MHGNIVFVLATHLFKLLKIIKEVMVVVLNIQRCTYLRRAASTNRG